LQHDALTGIIDSLSELKRMYQLNLELLEQLAVTCEWLQKSGIHFPNETAFFSLLNKTTTLLNEIQGSEPKILHFSPIRRKVTDEKTDEEVPEPGAVLFLLFSDILCIG